MQCHTIEELQFLIAVVCVYLCVALRKDLESMNTRHREVSGKLLEKNRQYQKLQVRTS